MLFERDAKPTTRLPWMAMLLTIALGWQWSVSAAALAEPPPTLRLRIAWGGRTPVQWAGRVSVSGGELSQLSLLGRECDAPGSIWIDEGTVLFAQPRSRTFDGFDITVAAPRTALLRIEMRAAGDDKPIVFEEPLSALMTHPQRSTLTSTATPGETTLLVHRVEDDALRIHTAHSTLIFAPGDTFRCEVEPVIAGLAAGGSLDLTAELVRGRSGGQEWTRTERVSLSPRENSKVPLEIPLPMRDGVYTVKLTARTPPGNRVKFWEATAGQQLAKRNFQVVVLGGQATTTYVDAVWQTQLEIDPANPKWWNRLPEWTRLDRWANPAAGPLGSQPFRTTNHQGRALAALSPRGVDAPSWQAYPLPAAEPGRPHAVEVDLPTDVAQKLVIRVFEPDSAGKLIPTGPGGGVVVDGTATAATAGTDGKLEPYRYLFWPRTSSPVVVIQNASQQRTAIYGAIRLAVAREVDSTATEVDSDPRMVAAYYEWQALLNRTTARPPTTDGKPPVDDWLTFYQAAERLAALVELSGYNTAVVNVMEGGSAAFDVGDYPTVPRLNTSRLVLGCTDLPAVDPLDLMLRTFSRRGLRFIPSLRFTATLPGVEAKLRRQEYRTLEQFPLWTNLQGQPCRAVRPESRVPQPPHYRLAHPDVAAEVRELVDNMIAQAAQYDAFAGVSVEISSDSYLAAPPAEYGITGPRLAQVAESTGKDSATLDSWIQQPDKLLDDDALRRAWLTHRATASTKLFASIAANLTNTRPEAKLLLLTPQLFDTREWSVRPQLVGGPRLDDLFLERGLESSALGEQSAILLPQVRHATTGLPLVDAATSISFNARSPQVVAQGTASAVTWMHTMPIAMPGATEFGTSEAETIVFDRLGGAASSPLTRVLYEEPGGPVVLGGPLGPGAMGDRARRATLSLAGKLPANPTKVASESSEQPIAVRVYSMPQGCVAVVINDSPWPTTATATLEVSERTTAAPLVANANLETAPTAFAAGRHAWSLRLDPYEVQALRFASSDVAISGIRVQIDQEVEQQLAARCAQLERRDLKPDFMTPYAQVANPSFEQTDAAGNATDWQSPEGVPTVTPGNDGQRAAQLISRGPGVQIATAPFPVPATGQIAVTGYVKVVDLADDAKLRLVVEEIDGPGQPPHVTLSAQTLLEHRRAKEWNVYQFGVEDLILDSTATMRIRVELTGRGEVWVDNLQVHDLVYPLRIYPESDQQVLALVQHVKGPRRALEARQYRDCEMLLDSYWSQFLIEYLPEIKVPSPEAVAPANIDGGSDSDPPAPRLTDRVRDWFRF